MMNMWRVARRAWAQVVNLVGRSDSVERTEMNNLYEARMLLHRAYDKAELSGNGSVYHQHAMDGWLTTVILPAGTTICTACGCRFEPVPLSEC